MHSEWIVSHVTKKKKLDLYLEFECILDEILLNKIRNWLLKEGKDSIATLINEINFAGNTIFCDERAHYAQKRNIYVN